MMQLDELVKLAGRINRQCTEDVTIELNGHVRLQRPGIGVYNVKSDIRQRK